MYLAVIVAILCAKPLLDADTAFHTQLLLALSNLAHLRIPPACLLLLVNSALVTMICITADSVRVKQWHFTKSCG